MSALLIYSFAEFYTNQCLVIVRYVYIESIRGKIMWLPKEERKLLIIYTKAIRKAIEKIESSVTNQKWYSLDDLINIYMAKDFAKQAENLKDAFHKATDKTYENSQSSNDTPEQMKKSIKNYLSVKAEIDAANNALAERNLIKITPHERQPRIGISLTIEGYDLGRKYADWFTCSGLHFKEYKDHWIWIILGFLAGVLGALLVELLKVLLT